MDAGYCTYYASTMVVLLRSEGVPARFVTGYTTGEQRRRRPVGRPRVNSHARVEVFSSGPRWVQLDPRRPGRERSQTVTDDDASSDGSSPTVGDGNPVERYTPPDTSTPAPLTETNGTETEPTETPTATGTDTPTGTTEASDTDAGTERASRTSRRARSRRWASSRCSASQRARAGPASASEPAGRCGCATSAAWTPRPTLSGRSSGPCTSLRRTPGPQKRRDGTGVSRRDRGRRPGQAAGDVTRTVRYGGEVSEAMADEAVESADGTLRRSRYCLISPSCRSTL